ncbi:hypothetical protein FRC0360_00686 [Corynebacterium diphtheriae]|nr:hypothetical protein FRC0360_00686 [Corynebacterium diphtheriae]
MTSGSLKTRTVAPGAAESSPEGVPERTSERTSEQTTHRTTEDVLEGLPRPAADHRPGSTAWADLHAPTESQLLGELTGGRELESERALRDFRPPTVSEMASDSDRLMDEFRAMGLLGPKRHD